MSAGVLERCRTVLGNMSLEREGFWNALLGRRWYIHHEPLRNDARNLLPVIEQAIYADDLLTTRLFSLAYRLQQEADPAMRDVADDILTILKGTTNELQRL